MLETIRRHQQSWLTYFLFGAIIVVFAVNFGPGSSSCSGLSGSSDAATVDGDAIRQQDFALTYSRRLEMMRRNAQRSNFEFTADMADKMGLKTQVIDGLVDKKLLAHEARRRGLNVSDEELLKYLQDSYGVKDVSEEQYRTWVERTFQLNVQRFEDEVRNEVRGQKLADVITDNVGVSDAELKADYLRDRDRAMIEFVRFDPTQMKAAEPTAAELDKLLADDGKAVQDKYDSDTFRYRTPEERHARQIVVKLAADASDADVAAAKSKLLELKGQIDGGADFGALATANSQDEATKAKGGDMGAIRRGQTAKVLEDAVFGLKKDEITKEPLRSPFGLHLIQVTEVVPPKKKEFEEVKRDVASALLKERAGDGLAEKKAAALLASLNAGKALHDLTISDDAPQAERDAEQKKPEPRPTRVESPWILKSQEALPRIGVSPEMHAAIFALTKEKPVATKAYKVGRAYFVAVLKDRETPDLAKFETEKPELQKQAVWSKKNRVLEDWMKHLRSQARVELNPDTFGAPQQGEDEG